MPSLVREVLHRRGEPKVLKLIAMELEFRRGTMARTLQRQVLHLLFEHEAARYQQNIPLHLRYLSLAFVLRLCEERIRAGVDLLGQAGLCTEEGTFDEARRYLQLRRAMYRPDHGRRRHLTGAPGSIERYRLLIDVFSRAITIVNAHGLAFGSHANYVWPRDRRCIIQEMQRALRAQRQGV